MADPAPKLATYADLVAVPEHLVAEILEGSLYTHPRPTPRHAVASSGLNGELSPPFQYGRGGPGGWIFMVEPELHLGQNILVPDLAGWRHERLPTLPDTAYLETAPDWICEVLSPATQVRDKGVKRRLYAEAGVGFLWHLEPASRLLEAFRLVGENWLLMATVNHGDMVSLPPFDAISFPLADLFPFDPVEGAVSHPSTTD